MELIQTSARVATHGPGARVGRAPRAGDRRHRSTEVKAVVTQPAEQLGALPRSVGVDVGGPRASCGLPLFVAGSEVARRRGGAHHLAS